MYFINIIIISILFVIIKFFLNKGMRASISASQENIFLYY